MPKQPVLRRSTVSVPLMAPLRGEHIKVESGQGWPSVVSDELDLSALLAENNARWRAALMPARRGPG